MRTHEGGAGRGVGGVLAPRPPMPPAVAGRPTHLEDEEVADLDQHPERAQPLAVRLPRHRALVDLRQRQFVRECEFVYASCE